mgnify:CR=1 FL=1
MFSEVSSFLDPREQPEHRQASWNFFDGDQETIDKIDPMIAQKMGFKQCYPVSGQTYSRKVDTRVLNILAGIAASAHKMSNDIRLLQHLKEVEEPFEKSQIGSSAMAYKRNPMRSERIASLSRYVMIDALNPAITSATQWFERTLDDSATSVSAFRKDSLRLTVFLTSV